MVSECGDGDSTVSAPEKGWGYLPSRKEEGPLSGSAPKAAARLPGEAGTSAQGRRFGVSCSYTPLLKYC